MIPGPTVGDLMSTALVTLHSGELVAEAHTEMTLGGFRHLPVTDRRGRLIGVLSDRDLLAVLARRARITVDAVMTRDVETVTPETPAADAALRMLELRIGALPVVDAAGVLVGVVTATDFLDVARRALLGQRLERPA